MKLALLMPIAFATINAAAVDLTMAGIQLGANFPYPECEKIKIGASSSYVIASTKTCFRDAVQLPGDDGGFAATIVLAIGSYPRIVKNGWLTVLVTRKGRIAGVNFTTHGIDSQVQDIAVLTEKYGEPTSRSSEKVQNRLGATFDSSVLTWKSPDLTVSYFATVGQLDSGALFADTPEAAPLRKARSAYLDSIGNRNKL